MVPADSELASGDRPEPPPAPMQPPAESEEEEPEDEDEEETPEALRKALKENWSASITAILQAGRELRDSLATGAQVAKSSLESSLDSYRAVRDEIHRDIHAERIEQVRGCDEHLVAAAHDLLHEHLRCALKTEKADVLKAAKCVVRGQNFCEWLETHYRGYASVLAERIKPAVEAYQMIRLTCYEPHVVHAENYCLRHKSALMRSADGSRSKFLERIQSVLDSWDAEIGTIRLGD
jgi:hypothetical protein